MRKFFLILTAIVLPNITFSDVPVLIEGRFDCEVKYNKIIETKEGITTDYDRIKGQRGVGDKLSVFYYLEENRETSEWRLGLKTKDGYSSNYRYLSIVTVDHLLSISETFGTVNKDTSVTNITDDDLRFYEGGNNSSSLKRYYKGDWEMLDVFNFTTPLDLYYVRVSTLDCRHKLDRILEIQSELISQFG